MLEETFILENKLGLHARPAAEIARLVSKYSCRVLLQGNGKKVDARSAIMIMTMGMTLGQQLTVSADGEDEDECMAEIKEFILNKFYEE